MEDVWGKATTARFGQLFVSGDVDDSGILSDENKGLLYDPNLGLDEEQNPLNEGFTGILGEETETFVHDFRSAEQVAVGNYYILP